jgi:hypothetical protein
LRDPLSLIAQVAKAIDDRVHLGNAGAPIATLKVDEVGTVAFNNGAWNRAASPIDVLIKSSFARTYARLSLSIASLRWTR